MSRRAALRVAPEGKAAGGMPAALQARLYRSALDSIALPIVVFERRSDECVVRYVNPAFSARTGYSAEEIQQLGWDALRVESGREREPARLAAAIRDGRELEMPLRIRGRDGVTFAAELHVSPMSLPGAHASSLALGVLHEPCAGRALVSRLEHAAHHDPLTGLPNRRLLARRAGAAVARALRERRVLGIALVDLDGFKAINDTCGHAAGDEVLRTVSARLARQLRPSDFIARVGGDEFVLLLADLEEDGSLAALIERVRNHVERPIQLHGQTFGVSCSIGVALCPAEGADFDGLLERADRAMYRQKALRRSAAASRFGRGALRALDRSSSRRVAM